MEMTQKRRKPVSAIASVIAGMALIALAVWLWQKT
jgi:hypothetical protein